MSQTARPLRVIFAGTPEFARIALERIHGAGHTIALVLSQPDRPAGRGMKLQASAVKQFALEQQIAVAQPRSLRLDGKFPQDAEAARLAIAEANADVMVVAAYGLILPQWVLDDMAAPYAAGSTSPATAHGVANKLGCLNIHGSLLPRWRGAAPIHRAIEAGDIEIGVTIMQMDAGLDTGDMLSKQALTILATDTTATLHDKVAELGATMVVQTLEQASLGRLHPEKQGTSGITYAHKIEKHEAALDWAQSAASIVRRVRAFNPFPAASAVLNGETLKVWSAHVGDGGSSEPSGTILAVAPAGIAVAAMNSIVVVTELQRAGGKRLPVADFVHGFDLQPGQCFDASVPAATPQAPGP